MSRQDIDTGVEGAEAGLARHRRETTVIRNKVHHFLLHILAKFFHLVGSFGHTRGHYHVRTDFGGIFVVFEGEAPVGRERVFGGLCRNRNLGRRDLGCHGGDQRSTRGNFQEIGATRCTILESDRRNTGQLQAYHFRWWHRKNLFGFSVPIARFGPV
jgi:hypothetical protein